MGGDILGGTGGVDANKRNHTHSVDSINAENNCAEDPGGKDRR